MNDSDPTNGSISAPTDANRESRSARLRLIELVSKMPKSSDLTTPEEVTRFSDEGVLGLISDRVQAYLSFKSRPALNVKNQDVIAKLESIQKAHRKFLRELSGLDDKTLMQIIDSGSGIWSLDKIPVNEKSVQGERWYGLSELESSLGAFRRFGSWMESALRTAPPVPLGRPSSEENLVWLVKQLGYLFTRRTGLKFSRTENGTVRPAEFVSAALQAELPEEELTEWKLDHLMKLAIKKMGKNENKSDSSVPR